MSHHKNCEIASGHRCVCRCGGALHGAMFVRAIYYSDGSSRSRAIDYANQRRWAQMRVGPVGSTVRKTVAVRRQAVSGILSEFVINAIKTSGNGRSDVIEVLAMRLSDEIGGEMEQNLRGGPPARRGDRHLWCVVLATICRLYDETFAFSKKTVDGLLDGLMKQLSRETSRGLGEETSSRDLYSYRRGCRVIAAFEVAEYEFLGVLAKQAIDSVLAAMKQVGEEAVMRQMRMMTAVMCPDPDRHPDVIKYCIWPLLSGPFREALEEGIEEEMRVWLRNTYPCVGTHS